MVMCFLLIGKLRSAAYYKFARVNKSIFAKKSVHVYPAESGLRKGMS